MKKQHHESLKFHTIYNLALGLVFVALILFRPNLTLLATLAFLFLYVIGNGVIHATRNKLSRDIILEYIILSAVVIVVVIGATIN